MEIGTNDYGPNNKLLIEKMKNGRNTGYRLVNCPFSFSTVNVSSAISTNVPLRPAEELPSRVFHTYTHTKEQQHQCCSESRLSKSRKSRMSIDTGHLCKSDNVYATPFYRQLAILLTRTFLLLWRDHSLTTLRFSIHFGVALLIGFLYYDIGNDAANAMNIFRYVFYTIMFIMFCAFSSILTKCKEQLFFNYILIILSFFSSPRISHSFTRTFQSLVFTSRILYCDYICRYTNTNYMHESIHISHVLSDWTAYGANAIHFVLHDRVPYSSCRTKHWTQCRLSS